MEDKRKSQIEKVLNACRKAYNCNIPIIYLLTEEIEIADEIVNSEALIPFMHLIPSDQKAVTVYEAFQYECESQIHEKDINIKKLLPYLKELLSDGKEDEKEAVKYLLNKIPAQLKEEIKKAHDEADFEKAVYDIGERDSIAEQNNKVIHRFITFLNSTILPDRDFYDKKRFAAYQKQIYYNQTLHALCLNMEYSDEDIRKRNRLLLGYMISKAFGRTPEYYESISKISVDNREVGYSLSNFFGNYDTVKFPRIGVIKNYNLSIPIDNQLSGYIHAYINAKSGSSIKKSILILTAPVLKISAGFEPYMEVIKVPHLEDWEIHDIIERFVNSRNKPGRLIEAVPNKDYIDKMIASLRGFS
ncbi:MAG TPA: hypothetical protein VN258_18980, partial [Mobilitalea sp.]|nr:hypothetical protein [Mobilitalea sp.]